MLGHVAVDDLHAGGGEVVGNFQLISGLTQGLGHDGVEGGVGVGDGVGRAHHAELELVAGEGEGSGAVAVGGVTVENGDGGYTGVQLAGGQQLNGVRVGDDLLHYALQLVAQKDGDDGGGSLLAAQTVLVAHTGGGLAQQVGVDVHGLHDAGEDQQELEVLVGGVAGVQQVLAGIGADGPVVVFAAAVDAGKGLLVEQAHQTVTGGYPLHGLHGQLVLVHGQVAHGVDGGHLVLSGGHLIVLGDGGDAQLPQLLVQVGHEVAHPLTDNAEVLVVQLLALGGGSTEEGAAGVDEIPAVEVLFPVYQEVFLLRAD